MNSSKHSKQLDSVPEEEEENDAMDLTLKGKSFKKPEPEDEKALASKEEATIYTHANRPKPIGLQNKNNPPKSPPGRMSTQAAHTSSLKPTENKIDELQLKKPREKQTNIPKSPLVKSTLPNFNTESKMPEFTLGKSASLSTPRRTASRFTKTIHNKDLPETGDKTSRSKNTNSDSNEDLNLNSKRRARR